MKEKRSLFNMIFGKKQQTLSSETQLKMLSGFLPYFTAFGDNAYDSDVVRTAIDAIARHAAKLKPKHQIRINGKISPQESQIQKLIQSRPNKFMDAYTFYYKTVTQLYMQNNAFIFLDIDNRGIINGLYPINSTSVELLEYGGEVYAKFRFMGGNVVVLPYTELIHLRRFFYRNDFYGETNNAALTPTLDLINTTNQGISNAIKSSAFLRGILKFTQAMLKDTDLKAQRDKFMTDYMDINNNGGVAATDAKMEYQELKGDPKIVNSFQMDFIEQKVYKYFGISKEIVMSSYDENQWNSFYESIIEPIAIMLSLEFTEKIFSTSEKNAGNEIIFEANRLMYANNKTKTLMLTDLIPLGLFSINEAREILNLSPVEGGERHIQSLNFVDASQVNAYQGVGNNTNKTDGGSSDGQEGNKDNGTSGDGQPA
jgi:HK97 family phage portal protein